MSDGMRVDVAQRGAIPLNVQLHVAPGETVALVGPSGAGKSTLVRAIAGLHRPDAGTIHCNGQCWLDRAAQVDLPAHHRRVGLVFQSYALFPHRSAAANVAEALLHLPRRDRLERAEHLLAQVHLDGLGDRFPHQLSGGQQQRVALARALARDPQVLLLDEPFSAVDQPTRRALHRLLMEIRRDSALPIVIVSHDVADAARIADRICLMYHGELVEQGAGDALLADPASRLSRWLDSEG